MKLLEQFNFYFVNVLIFLLNFLHKNFSTKLFLLKNTLNF